MGGGWLLVCLVLASLLFWGAWRLIRGPREAREPQVHPEQQSRWQGWDVWIIGLCLASFGGLWLYRLSEKGLHRSVLNGVTQTGDIVLHTAVATVILLAGVAFLWMLAKNIKTPSATRSDSWKRKLGRSIVPTFAVVLLLRTFVVAPFWSVTDASAPEIPRGSLVLVWKLTRTFAPGDLIAYADKQGHVNIGRIEKPGQDAVFVKRNNSDPTSVLHSDIVGKVISVVWRGTPQALVPAPIEKAAALNRTGPVFPYTISGRTTGGKPLEVGGFADVIVTIHGADPSNPEVRPIVRGAKVTKITDNDSSISNYRLVDLELELTQAEVDLIKLHAYRRSFSFAPVDPPQEGERRFQTMNAKQKTLTWFAVVAIGLTSLFAAWDLTGSTNHTNATRYAPIFAPPDLGPWAKRELASSVFWSWLVIGVIYSGLFVAFRQEPPTSRPKKCAWHTRNVRLRIVAGDTLQPVEGVGVRYTLIGDDGGDGGHAEDFTSADGSALLTGYCGPGRYQIHLIPPAGSRFRRTAYTSPETTADGGKGWILSPGGVSHRHSQRLMVHAGFQRRYSSFRRNFSTNPKP